MIHWMTKCWLGVSMGPTLVLTIADDAEELLTEKGEE